MFAAGLAGVSALAVALAAPPTGNSGSDLAGAPGSVKPIPRPAASPSPRPTPVVVVKPAPQLQSKPVPQVAAKPSPNPAPRVAASPQTASGAIDLRAPPPSPPPVIATQPDDREVARQQQQADRDLAGGDNSRRDDALDNRDDDRTDAFARDDRDDDDRYADRDDGDGRYASRDDRDEEYAGRDPRMLDRDWGRQDARVYRGERRPDFRDAVRACERAGLAEARDRRFYSLDYLANPRLVETRYGFEVRGRVEMEDRRGVVRMDSTCVLDRGRAVDFRLFR